MKILDGSHWDEKLIKDFRKEVEIMTSLHHPNVVLLMGACASQFSAFFYDSSLGSISIMLGVEEGHLDIVTELLENNLQSIVHSKDIKLRFVIFPSFFFLSIQRHATCQIRDRYHSRNVLVAQHQTSSDHSPRLCFSFSFLSSFSHPSKVVKRFG